jgi:hypothetical protein
VVETPRVASLDVIRVDRMASVGDPSTNPIDVQSEVRRPNEDEGDVIAEIVRMLQEAERLTARQRGFNGQIFTRR